MSKTLQDRFWSKVRWQEHGGCYEWLGKRDKQGYGAIHTGPGKKMQQAHRTAWELAWGAIPAGLVVMHKVCDNPSCVNVAHLQLGTWADNAADMAAKGRA